MNLNELLQLVSEYIDQELDRRVCCEIEESLKEDCECRTFFNTFQRTVVMCRRIEKRRVPRRVHYTLYRRIRIHIKSKED